MMLKKRHSSILRILTVAVCLVVSFTACTGGLPDRDSEEYRQAVSDFYISIAAGQTDDLLFAYNKMNSVTDQYPGEPAAWANLAVYALRQGNIALANERLATGRNLAPENPDILHLSGLLESRSGNIEGAINWYRRAISVAPGDLRSGYALVSELERQDDTGNEQEIVDHLQRMLLDHPDNLALLYEVIRVAVKYRDSGMATIYLDQLTGRAGDWPENIREQLSHVSELVMDEAFQTLVSELVFLRNGLDELPEFRDDLSDIQPDSNEVGFLITEFLWLPNPEARSAPPDTEMRFTQVIPENMPESTNYLGSLVLDRESVPRVLYGSGNRIFTGQDSSLIFPGTDNTSRLPDHAITSIDFNDDFRNDLVFAGEEGLRVYRQNEDHSFTDITGNLNLPEDIISRQWHGVWRSDMDLDGDLDIILTSPEGSPVMLRNNGDNSFTAVNLFPGVSGVVDFITADLTTDGIPEAIILNRDGSVSVWQNRRSHGWEIWDVLTFINGAVAIAVADTDADSYLDLLVLDGNNRVIQLSPDPHNENQIGETVIISGNDLPELFSGNAAITAVDFDNNGRLDILVSSDSHSQLWLGSDNGTFEQLTQDLPGRIYTHFDINGNERLDLLGISPDGELFHLMNSGTMEYGTLSLRAFASGTEGDSRINSFGIGGEMEIRSGLLYQKQMISSPVIHFGLGDYESAEMLRIIWPNGSVQAEFAEQGMGSTIFNEQILKGSCPWLFSFDGENFRFVTDILWRSPLGLRINAQETAGVAQTLDRVKINPEMLKPHNGLYDLRVTAELWETHFFDHTRLVAVDHPVGTDVFIDERFAFPLPDLSTRIMRSPRPVSGVVDHKGNDVSEKVREADGDYLRTFDKTRYQGLVEDHYLEIDLGNEPSVDRPLWLVASGWLRPTDSSLNLALSQNELASPAGLRIEVSDGRGGWRELHTDYGFPAGKQKTILIDLDGEFTDISDRRVRMHTTSEIYWDVIRWAEGEDEKNIIERPLSPVRMELRYRGYSDWSRKSANAPMLPDYNMISGTTPRWRDLTGYHTRFGDVSELLEEIDDRYVIMNAGDELHLQFEEIDDPPEGWTRSFIFVSDGWEKDGDYNTQASQTVLPLPFHGQQNYASEPTHSLQNDPVYQRFREDWAEYHTRYITPEPFHTALTPDP